MGKNKGLNIILWALLVGVVAALSIFYFIKDEYDTESTIEIKSSEKEDDLLIAMKSDQIMEKVIEDNNLSISNDDLKKAVNINHASDNSRYQLNVSYNTKEDSIALTDMYAKAIEQDLGDIVQVDNVKILSSAKDKVVNNASTLPRVLYIGAGLLIGALFGFLISTIKNPKNKKQELDDRKNALAKYPVLGTIRIY